MYFIGTQFITGALIGGEFITYEELGYEGDGWYLSLNFAIFRLVIEKGSADELEGN